MKHRYHGPGCRICLGQLKHCYICGYEKAAGWAADYRILEWEAERRIESDRERLVQEQE